jgi:hypothetical protein
MLACANLFLTVLLCDVDVSERREVMPIFADALAH